MRPVTMVVALWMVGAVIACDQTFEPRQASDRAFSIFGYLDPVRDTQWIRVTLVRPSIFTPPQPSGVSVSLRDQATGRIIQFRDSLFVYPHNQEVGSDGVHIRNYWTSERIDVGAVYEFTAITSDGTMAEAVIPIPSEYSISVAHGQSPTYRDELRVSGVSHLAFAGIRRVFQDSCTPPRLRRTYITEARLTIPEGSTAPHVVHPFKLEGDIGSLFGVYALDPGYDDCMRPILQLQELWMAASEAAWPRGAGTAEGALGVSDIPTNLSNAVGYVGAVLTRVVPYEDCTIVGPGQPPHHCVLTYDPGFATLRGTVNDADCFGSVVEAIVQLEELVPDADGFRKRRPTTTRSNGGYEISALGGGMRYALSVTHAARVPGDPALPLFIEHVDTLEFSPGEVLSNDVALRRRAAC